MVTGGGGSTVEGSSTSKHSPSHHEYNSPKQFELKCVRRKIGHAKHCIKVTNRIKMIATKYF